MKSYIKKDIPISSEIFEIHAKEQTYLFIQKSQIPNSGNGLFTAIPILKNERIAVFSGEILSQKESTFRTKNHLDHYFIAMIDGTILDSIASACFAKYANDAEGFIKSKYQNNAYLTLDLLDQVCIVASKKITPGSEIFCSYGKAYWENYHKHLSI